MATKKAKPAAVENKAPERMDIRTIARAANVSIATVSRTINHVPTVNPEIAKRVWEVIDQLDYFPNTQARALVSGRSKIFGLIVSEITNPFFPELIQGFEDIAVEHAHQLPSQANVALHPPHAGAQGRRRSHHDLRHRRAIARSTRQAQRASGLYR